MAHKNKNLKLFFHQLYVASFFIPLLYFQERVNFYKIYYNVKKFGKIIRYFNKYQLPQYRKIHRSEITQNEKHFQNSTQTYLNALKNPSHVRVVKYFFAVYVIRSIASLLARFKGGSRELKIWLGHEMMGIDGFYIETTFLMWASLGLLFTTFTLSGNLLDYKFLALNSMSADGRFFHPKKDFGLSEKSFEQFKRFRARGFGYFYLISCTLTPVAFACVVFLHIQCGFYVSRVGNSVLYTFVHCYFIFIVIPVIYYNLIDFTIVAYYIHLKQSYLGGKIEISSTALIKCTNNNSQQQRLSRVSANFSDENIKEIGSKNCIREFNKLLSLIRIFNRLLDEIADYNSFWQSYLTFVFVIYVFLIAFITFICFFGKAIFIIHFAYCHVLFFHILSVGGIIFFSGAIVRKNEKIVNTVVSMVGQKSLAAKNFDNGNVTFLSHLKMHNLSQNLKAVSSCGFCLLNGYVITHDTFRLLAVNIVIYFLLVVGPTWKMERLD